jgi:sugar lactone lactonase YvrE
MALKRTLWVLPFLIALPLLAVTPFFWETRTNDDFRKGTFSSLSLTSEDRLVLAPRFESVFNTDQPFVWSAAADSKGNVYLGTGHDGKIFRVDSSGKGTLLADLPELDVFAIAIDSKDAVYAATSPDGKVYKIETGGQPQTFFNPDDKYIWSLAFDKQGRLIVATGDKGIIYRVGTDGRGQPFYDTDETHVISLAVDKDGNVIAGGDPKGYLYRISPDGKAFVLYDSGMREVHAVTVAPDGTIYAAVVSSRPGLSPNSVPIPVMDASGAGGGGVTVTLSAENAAAQSVDVSVSPDAGPTIGPSSASSKSDSKGAAQSAILEVLPNGTVNTIWRSSSEMVYSLLPRGDRLLFSTGTKGRIYSFQRPRNTTLLVESTEEHTTSLIQVANRVFAASSNSGKLFSLGDAIAASGSYESKVQDTDAISSWGKISWKSENPQLIQVFTRSGNTSSPDKTWSEWARVDGDGSTSSPKARFFQWRAVLRADSGRSPSLNSLTVPYLQQNFRPEISSLDVLPFGVALIKVQALTSTGAPAGPQDAATTRATARAGLPGLIKQAPRRALQKGSQSFQWVALDKNEDALQYDLYYRNDADRNWVLLKKNVEDNFYTINSDTLPDGAYVVRLVASDAMSNSAESGLSVEMESRPFTVDNTPPTVTMKQEGLNGGRVRIAIDTADLTSTLNQAEISVDAGEFRAVFPRDGIADSKNESFAWQSETLPSGEHVVAFRIYDQNDNVGLGKLVVRIP